MTIILEMKNYYLYTNRKSTVGNVESIIDFRVHFPYTVIR